ncbi:tubulin polymerization-promoting protein family member 2 [Lingula anatina]|uniref:Tubulin polymerization-promoting protein family member 2 n=1 Tax=Lingula anatina TaxID=7574 RepID=A0A1S3IXF0_LINAN|nr:tubulin polymerization-promoting protein family member 2 [Lingula anatina]|eukprot:XP_013402882.1 tubulin polymerization-promoting protein family member 2 [Lingula anatina]
MSDSDLKAKFLEYCTFGGQKDKTTITTKNVNKMFKDCNIFNKKFNSNALDIAFSKILSKGPKGAKELNFQQFKDLLALQEIKDAHKDKDIASIITGGGGPSLAGTTGTSKTGNVAGMTDTSKYTGSHKERFDESGKGKGIGGRADIADGSGYVGNYKGAGTYDATH